jgi:DNA-binding Lrp family transcriptional regulator
LPKAEKIHLEILEKLGEGLSLREVAVQTGFSLQTVFKTKKKATERILSLYREGVDSRLIAERLGFPLSFVERVLENADEEQKRIETLEKIEQALKEGGRREGGEESEDLSHKGIDINIEQEEEKMASEPERTEEVREFSASTKILRDLLRRVRGISESDIETICEFHEECPELYESNPWALTNLLSAYGIKAPKVNFIVQQYLTALYGTPIASNVPWGGWNPGTPQWNPYMCPVPWGSHNTNPGKSKEEEIDLDKEMKRFLQAQTIATLRGGGMMQPGPFMAPFSIVKTEPVLDASGKPVKDEFGNPVVKTTFLPFMPSMEGGGKKEEGGGSRVVEELLKMEKDRSDKMEAKILELTKALAEEKTKVYEERIKDLQERLNALAQRNPLDDVSETLSKLKELGVLQSTNPEIVRMNTELQKWMHEQSISLEKWKAEQEEKRLERLEGIERMKQWGKIVSEGIDKVGSKLAGAFAEGYLMGKTGGGGSNPFSVSVSEMPTEVLEQKLSEATSLKQKLEQAITGLQQELARRKATTQPASS